MQPEQGHSQNAIVSWLAYTVETYILCAYCAQSHLKNLTKSEMLWSTSGTARRQRSALQIMYRIVNACLHILSIYYTNKSHTTLLYIWFCFIANRRSAFERFIFQCTLHIHNSAYSCMLSSEHADMILMKPPSGDFHLAFLCSSAILYYICICKSVWKVQVFVRHL